MVHVESLSQPLATTLLFLCHGLADGLGGTLLAGGLGAAGAALPLAGAGLAGALGTALPGPPAGLAPRRGPGPGRPIGPAPPGAWPFLRIFCTASGSRVLIMFSIAGNISLTAAAKAGSIPGPPPGPPGPGGGGGGGPGGRIPPGGIITIAALLQGCFSTQSSFSSPWSYQ